LLEILVRAFWKMTAHQECLSWIINLIVFSLHWSLEGAFKTSPVDHRRLGFAKLFIFLHLLDDRGFVKRLQEWV